MLKHPITYETFDGETITETFYFNLSKPELIDLQVGEKDGYAAFLKRIIASENPKDLVEIFKKIILMAYGEKSEDGKRFIKSEEMKIAFSQTAAYEELFMTLATEDGAAAAFVTGLLPKDVQGEISKLPEAPTTEVAAPEAPAPQTTSGQ